MLLIAVLKMAPAFTVTYHDFNDHPLLKNMIQIPEYLGLERAQECLNDLNYYRDEIRALFRSGQIDLPNMAKTEETYLFVINKIKNKQPVKMQSL